MDTAVKFQDQRLFFLTGQRGADLQAVDAAQMRPALLAPYRDLTRLRYDYPLVLVDDAAQAYVRPLSALVNEMLQRLAPRGIEGERLRRRALAVEHQLRRLAAAGANAPIAEMWAEAVDQVCADDAAAQQVLRQAGELFGPGTVVDCDAHLARRLLSHLWARVHAEKRERFRRRVDDLTRRLSDILRAAYFHSAAGQQPAALRAAVGAPDAVTFDFDVLSQLVGRNTPRDELPVDRRRRIEWSLAVLRGQSFYSSAPDGEAALFHFEDCASAAAAYRRRLPQLTDVVKAMAMAELEAEGRYMPAEHDGFFAAFNENSLTAEDLALFPDYLVTIAADGNDAPENAGLLDLLSSGLPIKALISTPDLFDNSAIGTGHFAFGVRSARLATTAMGLGGMFVLQSASSQLPALKDRLLRGLRSNTPALFCLYGGAPAEATALPPYLSAAVAAESRAFPAFVYDAAAGANWAARFSLAFNPLPQEDWARQPLVYADETQQRVVDEIAFTFADFVLCESRYAQHFAVVPRDRWSQEQVPADRWLRLSEAEAAQTLPYVLAVDGQDRLHRVLVDQRVMAAARRALLLWHRLQEHAGIHDSHAEQLLAREKAAWAAQSAATAAAVAAPDATAAVTPATTAPEAALNEADAAEAKPPSDTPWIETSRCPSCGECQAINDRMFGYNDNKQAVLKDITAGTYRQLVEAAEACQVAIIHPGKPRNPDEPGLAELIERAAPFQ